jgi:tRNA nucleotidyltransferase/poly(A) polymerase
MKLRSLLALITQVQTTSNISPIFITGGIARDKALDKLNGTHLLKNINDIDLTTGDNSIHTLAKNLGIELGKSFSIKTRELDDGHSSIFLGKLKIDMSSNFITPNIDTILKAKGINNPSDLDKEMWSRDYTCNSLLLSLDLKTIKDPTHQGIKDIKNKVLRTCLDPNITLKSNLNRIPRVFYLAAKLGFSVDPDIIKWIAENKNLIHQIKPGYLAKTMEKAFHYDVAKTNQLIKETGVGDIIKPQTKTAQLVFKKNFDYGDRADMLKKRLELFKKSLPHILAYFAGHDDPFNEYTPGLDVQYYSGRTDDDHEIGENSLSTGNKDRTNSIPKELEGFRKDRKKRLKRIKLHKILEEMGVDLPDTESDEVVLEGHPYSDDAFNQGVSGLFSYPLSYTGTITDNPNTITDEYSKIYQRTD